MPPTTASRPTSGLPKCRATTRAAARRISIFGLCEYQLGHFEKAAEAFRTAAESVPLTEVLNDLGAAESRRDQHVALDYFRKAAEADPSDADYHFNYAVALVRKGDFSAAQHQLREGLSRNPEDAEADRLLQTIVTTHAAPATLPLPRIKRNYEESGYRQPGGEPAKCH